MIKYYIHGGSVYIFPQYSDNRSFIKELMEVARQASAAREEAGATHAVYAVKIYGEDGALDHVDVYTPPVLMTDQEFEERTAAEYKAHPGCVIYASHAHE
jgi:hypothetical protein